MTRKKSEDAVSPVIGIMLMLVVTVIIVAVVASFANGMVEDTETAPMAKLDVQIYSQHNVKSSVYDMDTYEQIVVDTYIPDLHVTHVSGDPIDTKDLKFTFSWEVEFILQVVMQARSHPNHWQLTMEQWMEHILVHSR